MCSFRENSFVGSFIQCIPHVQKRVWWLRRLLSISMQNCPHQHIPGDSHVASMADLLHTAHCQQQLMAQAAARATSFSREDHPFGASDSQTASGFYCMT